MVKQWIVVSQIESHVKATCARSPSKKNLNPEAGERSSWPQNLWCLSFRYVTVCSLIFPHAVQCVHGTLSVWLRSGTRQALLEYTGEEMIAKKEIQKESIPKYLQNHANILNGPFSHVRCQELPKLIQKGNLLAPLGREDAAEIREAMREAMRPPRSSRPKSEKNGELMRQGPGTLAARLGVAISAVARIGCVFACRLGHFTEAVYIISLRLGAPKICFYT